MLSVAMIRIRSTTPQHDAPNPTVQIKEHQHCDKTLESITTSTSLVTSISNPPMEKSSPMKKP
jgi:hypothetical protein